MAKIDMFCPFTRRLCNECAVYRGRHYYLCFCKHYHGYIGEPKENSKAGALYPDFEALMKRAEPWADTELQPDTELNIKLKVTDMESGKTRVCGLDEAKTWDWSNPEMMRVIGSVQITSWDKLVKLLHYKAERGYREVEVYEAPRFMLLGGG